jgi:disease resistance protein RPS2
MMADPGFVSGFVGVGIEMAVNHILGHIKIALRCKKQLISLRDLVLRIQPVVTQIQQYRLALNRREILISQSNIKASAVNEWLKKLDSILLQASTMAQECTVPRCDLYSRYRTSRRITRLISDITKHLDLVPLMGWASLLEGLGHIKENNQALASSSANTSSATNDQPDLDSMSFFINEPLIVGQHSAREAIEKLVVDGEDNSPFSLIGVLGKGGSGKTLLLKALFNRIKVSNFYSNGLLLWLTVSQTPCFTRLRKELSAQIGMQTKADSNKNMNEEGVKIWLHDAMHGKRFVLFLDDVWEEGAKLIEELGLLLLTGHSNSKVIVSSRNRRTLVEMGVNAQTSITAMGDLMKDDSWELFCYHAFRYNNGNLPSSINEETAKVVCAKCGGLPLAIKTTGRAMAGITDAHEWELAAKGLPNANRQDKEALYHRLRLSYDALGSYHVNLQMCFLYIAATYSEDQIVDAWRDLIPLWIGEGLVGRKNLQDEADHDPFQIGEIYVNILDDRCLIEPIARDVYGRVLYFKMHDVLRDLGIQIAEQEENFYCGVGKGFTALIENQFSGCTRILLNHNKLSSFPEALRASEISSLLMARNNALTSIPRKMLGHMNSLKVLDLSWTSLQSLPESVGCLKQLVYLRLLKVPIKRLPASLTKLAGLQILQLGHSGITELPSDIHKLRSLRYLGLSACNDLQCLPSSVSGLTSLQRLFIGHGTNPWTKSRGEKAACINDLGALTQLKGLHLANNGEFIREGTFGAMSQLRTLHLELTMMESLPRDIIDMAKLKILSLKSFHMVKLESSFPAFQNLSYLRLQHCQMLEELPHLHNLGSLRHLDIISCSKIKKFPLEFGERGAFSLLQTFSLVKLDELMELPEIEEGAMPSLKMFTMVKCEALKMLPENYLYLHKLQKLRVYGCSMVSENLKVQKALTKVEVITMSTTVLEEFLEKYFQQRDDGLEDWHYSSF